MTAQGWRVDEAGALRRETQHSMLRRCLGWNYSQPAIYMITVVLADRRSQALGSLVLPDVSGGKLPDVSSRTERKLPDVSGRTELGRTERKLLDVSSRTERKLLDVSSRTGLAELRPTPLGRAVEECWEAIPQFYPQVQIIAKQVMPDHFHGILWVKKPLGCHLGQVIKGFKIGCTKRYGRGAPLFATGFQDTILFREGQLAAMINYLRDNPKRLAIKRAHPDLFTLRRDLAIRLGEAGLGHFAAIGNHFLLSRPLVQVQCSRSYLAYKRVAKAGGGAKIARTEDGSPVVEKASPEFAEKREALLAAAKHGAVLLSPCISDGERQIAREALQAGLPLVTMHNKGFSPLQKPAGKLVEACAEGRLLMLAPSAWPYVPGEKPMTRFDATAMNRLCQWIAGDGAAEINYHGMRPGNIDQLARDAVRAERKSS